ncbi:MAG: ABC transporter permease [Syntrophales bacterium]|nr:ABC transporter permease [Syntrophales bacterium]MCK9527900.1 ABC transporter permease [Syntrophales bacterium]MDX9921925.1 ABC transporter permease [Syntrophales bacterium]
MKKRDGSVRLNVTGSAMSHVVISLMGSLSLDTMPRVSTDMKSHVQDLKPSRLTIDCSGVDYFDTAAALLIATFKEEAEDGGLPVELTNLSSHTRKIMSLADVKHLSGGLPHPQEQAVRPVAGIGDMTITAAREFRALITFLGEIILAFVHSLAHVPEIRWVDVASNVRRIGVQGLPIVGLISLLVGLIIAFMSSLQLKPLGGNIFVAPLVGIAMVKELAPLMTAIIVAGRSGSAFAAELGTMVVNEEVDALVIMGFDPMKFLVVPRVMAAFIVVPLLTLYADLFGLAGGLVVGVLGLDLTFMTYINQTGNSIAVSDITTGLIKSVVFAAIISGIGCHRGLRVERGAEGVGTATTSAVVTSIFLIVLADSIFAVVFHYL